MEKITFLYLSHKDIVGLRIAYTDIINSISEVMISHGRGQCECPPKPGIFPRAASFSHAMPAFIKNSDVSGMKWVSGYPGNREKGLPVINGLLILNDPDTGLPLAVMDCRWITAVRTAAVSAVTARSCKVSKSETMTIIGAGTQAKWHLPFLKQTVPELKRCYVNDIYETSVTDFIEEMQSVVPDVELIPAKSDMRKDAIAKSQIVLTATQNLPEPIVKKEMLHPGMLGIALEGKAWEDIIYTEYLDRFVCDDWALAQSYQQKGSFQLGMPKKYHILGNVIDGTDVGRADENEIVIAFNMGMAISDMALAAKIYNMAKEKNIGIRLPFMEQDEVIFKF